MIKMNNINKSFGEGHNERKIFNNFSFEINRGEMVAIMGKSGSGKTTLLNIIGGLESIDSGSYFFEETDVSKMNEKDLLKFRRNHISFVFQNFALINEYSVEKNILLPIGYKFGKITKKHKKRVDELLNRLEIPYVKNQKIEKLSGGEKQRIAIARTLISDTSVILADEPTGALDNKTGSIIINLFKELKEEGKTIIIVTHDIDVASKCDRIIEISN